MLNPWALMRNGFFGQRRLLLALSASSVVHLTLFDLSSVSNLPERPAAPALVARLGLPPQASVEMLVADPKPLAPPSAPVPPDSARANPAPAPSRPAVTPAPAVAPASALPQAETGWRPLNVEEALVMYRLSLWQTMQDEEMAALPAVGISLVLKQEAGGEQLLSVQRGSGDETLDARWRVVLGQALSRSALPAVLQDQPFVLTLELRP